MIYIYMSVYIYIYACMCVSTVIYIYIYMLYISYQCFNASIHESVLISVKFAQPHSLCGHWVPTPSNGPRCFGTHGLKSWSSFPLKLKDLWKTHSKSTKEKGPPHLQQKSFEKLIKASQFFWPLWSNTCIPNICESQISGRFIFIYIYIYVCNCVCNNINNYN